MEEDEFMERIKKHVRKNYSGSHDYTDEEHGKDIRKFIEYLEYGKSDLSRDPYFIHSDLECINVLTVNDNYVFVFHIDPESDKKYGDVDKSKLVIQLPISSYESINEAKKEAKKRAIDKCNS